MSNILKLLSHIMNNIDETAHQTIYEYNQNEIKISNNKFELRFLFDNVAKTYAIYEEFALMFTSNSTSSKTPFTESNKVIYAIFVNYLDYNKARNLIYQMMFVTGITYDEQQGSFSVGEQTFKASLAIQMI